MSSTCIYRLGKDPAEIGSTRNAWRGAMYVWDDVAKRYFGMTRFPMFSDPGQSKVWNAFKLPTMPRHEKLVLMSTMDYAVVKGTDAAKLAEAFEKYGSEHPNSSLADQAVILRSEDAVSADMIGWQQTSVSDFWGQGWDGEKDEVLWYDPIEGKHWDVFEALPAVTETI